MSLAAQPALASPPRIAVPASRPLQLVSAGMFPGLRALLWSGDVLYASRGYELFRATPAQAAFRWSLVAKFQPPSWRSLTSWNRLTSRFCRDGFHSLAALPGGSLVGAVPGAIVHKSPEAHDFTVTHRVIRGTRPLHVTTTPNGHIFWGEYFDNLHRDVVHIYASLDGGRTWDVAYTFPHHSIRHVHNIVFDDFDGGLWILTGDDADECRILRASTDLQHVEIAACGDQQARAVALVPMPDAVYFATDTPSEKNHIYRLHRAGGHIEPVASIASSCIEGCRVGSSIFFSTAAEPSAANSHDTVHLYGSSNGSQWRCLKLWRKDRWPMRFFQYGNAFLAAGQNDTSLLAVSTIAVAPGDLECTLWKVLP